MRTLMWFTIGFAAACALGAYAFSTWLWLLFFLSVVGFALTVIFRKRWKFSQIAAVLLGLTLGLGWFGLYRGVYLSFAVKADGTELSLSAQVIDYDVTTDYGSSVRAKITIGNRTYRAVLYLKDDMELQPGDRICGTFRLRMTHGGLEGDTYHRGSGIFLLAYAQDQSVSREVGEVSLWHYPAKFRQGMLDRLDVLFPEDVAFLAKALLLGDRSDVDYETNTAFKVSGISHIIAVSGLHVSILYSAIFLISVRKRSITALIGIPTLILFAAVTGFTPSVTRACVMQIMFMTADLFLREYDPPTALSTSVLLMLVVNPISITSASLQLSVGCMAGIILFSDRIQGWICGAAFWNGWRGGTLASRIRNWAASSISITLSSMFFTMPLVAYYFGCISLIGVVTNLLTLWVVSWIFYGLIAVCLVSLFWHQGAMILAWGVSWLMRYVLCISKSISAIPLVAVYTKSAFVTAWLILCYLLVFLFFLWRKRKPVVLICSVFISLAVALLLSWLLPLTSGSRVTVLDVGQGQSVILQSKGKTFLVDCGGDQSDRAADLAAETLLSMGIYRLDGLIVTHYDGDHVDGIPYLLSRISVDRIYLPEPTEDEERKRSIVNASGNSAFFVHRDLCLNWENNVLTVMAPVGGTDDNESGLCVLFRGENCDILITGDLSISGENTLYLTKDIPQLTALIAGHHGSAYSTGESLLNATNPQYVFISVGKYNHYGHPSEQVLDRLKRYDCTVYRTDLNGTIIFRR